MENSNKGEEKYQNVKIFVRVRPLNEQEDTEECIEIENNKHLKILRPGSFIKMRFDQVFSPKNDQDYVYFVIQENISLFLKGKNAAIFAYGQTGAGKTYTMMGDLYNNLDINISNFRKWKNQGILPRALSEIFAYLENTPIHYKMHISFFEVYNEKIYDLFNENKISSLDIRENKNGKVTILELTNAEIQSFNDIVKFLKIGLNNRAFGMTSANSNSSRSHSIFQVSLQTFNPKTKMLQTQSTLRFIDLAGSEKLHLSQHLSMEEKELRVQELTYINSSLSTLGLCISALNDKNRNHIPLRNSKLTRVLGDVFNGTSALVFIVCVSPSLSAFTETFSTLQFANSAKKAILDGRYVRSNREIKNSIKTEEENLQKLSELSKAYQEEKNLRISLEDYIAKNHPHLEIELGSLRQQNEDLKKQICQLKLNENGSKTISQRNNIIKKTVQFFESNVNENYSSYQAISNNKENQLIEKFKILTGPDFTPEIEEKDAEFWRINNENSTQEEEELIHEFRNKCKNVEVLAKKIKAREIEKKFQNFFENEKKKFGLKLKTFMSEDSKINANDSLSLVLLENKNCKLEEKNFHYQSNNSNKEIAPLKEIQNLQTNSRNSSSKASPTLEILHKYWLKN